MTITSISRAFCRYIKGPAAAKNLDYLRLSKMDAEAFRAHVNGLRAERRVFTPTEAELQDSLLSLNKIGIRLVWGAEEISGIDLESRFMRLTSTNTPYLSYFIRALHEVAAEMKYEPGRKIVLNLKRGDEFLGEKYAHLHPVDQKEIAGWFLVNGEYLPEPKKLII